MVRYAVFMLSIIVDRWAVENERRLPLSRTKMTGGCAGICRELLRAISGRWGVALTGTVVLPDLVCDFGGFRAGLSLPVFASPRSLILRLLVLKPPIYWYRTYSANDDRYNPDRDGPARRSSMSALTISSHS